VLAIKGLSGGSTVEITAAPVLAHVVKPAGGIARGGEFFFFFFCFLLILIAQKMSRQKEKNLKKSQKMVFYFSLFSFSFFN
jgi:hypothetical protein